MITRREFLRFTAIFGIPTLNVKKYLGEILFLPMGSPLKPDFRLWIIRPADLMDLEFGFINLRRNGEDRSKVSRIVKKDDAFMIVRLPNLHIGEQTFVPKSATTDVVAKTFPSGTSYLVFKFKPLSIANFTLNEAHLLDWKSENFFELALLRDFDYTHIKTSYVRADSYPGLTFASDSPVTTFRVPYGVSISPTVIAPKDKYSAILTGPNLIASPALYKFGQVKTREEDTGTRFLTAAGKGKVVDPHSEKAKPKIVNELWYNDLEYANPAIKLLFKVTGFDEGSLKDDTILPLYSDKKEYLTQFSTNDSADGSKQLIRLASEKFRISSLGLYAFLNYVNSDAHAHLQKIYQEIVFGRDQYIQVDRLGYMYPLGIRVIQISIGRRIIKNGVSFIEQRTYIAPLEKSLVLRSGDEQDVSKVDQSVAQRVIAGSSPEEVNYINSCKRSFPFQQIDVLTTDYIEIVDTRDELSKGKTDPNIIRISDDDPHKASVFWPMLANPDPGNKIPASFQFAGTDWDGKKILFDASFIFVDSLAVDQVSVLMEDKNTKLNDLGSGPFDEELLFIQQDLLSDKQSVETLLVKSKDALVADQTILSNKLNDLYAKLYKRYDQIVDSVSDWHDKSETDLNKAVAAAVDKERSIAEHLKSYAALETLLTLLGAGKNAQQHLLNLSALTFAAGKTGAADYDQVRASLKVFINDREGQIIKLEQALEQSKKKIWYKAVNRFHQLDQDISADYHRSGNKLRRQINIPNQKVAYYKTMADNAVADADKKINDLETQAIEFTAIPLSTMAVYKSRAKTAARNLAAKADGQWQKIADFGSQYNFTYPQLLLAQVKLPVVDQVMNAATNTAKALDNQYDSLQQQYNSTRLATIAYADAYRVAGIEGWKDGEKAANRNAEQILFDIRESQTVNAVSDDFNDAARYYQTHIRAPWESMGNKVRDFENTSIGVIKSRINNIFADAAAKVGGAINPGVAIEQISAIKDKAYTLRNDINAYTGEVNSYLAVGKNKANALADNLKAFEDHLNNYEIQGRDYLKQLLGDIRIFGMDVSDMLGDIHYTPELLPQAHISVIKTKNIPTGTEITYTWTPPRNKPLFNDGTGLIKFLNGNSPGDHTPAFIDLNIRNSTNFDIETSVVTNNFSSSIGLESFGISAADVISIYFKKLSFSKELISTRNSDGSGSSTSNTGFHLEISKVDFSGFLTLIKQLQDALGLGNNFLMDLDFEGISISYGIRIPNISTGGFTMSNMYLYAGLALHFNDRPPAMKFQFSSRANPFTMAVGIYGGRGFFAIEVSKLGIQSIEASLEFGGYVSLDVAGIAKGQAYLMAGIYFRKRSGESVYVESYVTCGGSLSIVGIIQMSIVFYVAMSYQDGALRGIASVEVSVSIMFFSASYNLTFQKQITGSSGISMNRLKPAGDPIYWADASGSMDQYLSAEAGPQALPDNAYCFLFVEDDEDDYEKNYQETRLIPVFDPTALFAEDADDQEAKDGKAFEKYISQFAV